MAALTLISILRSFRQKDHKFKVNMNYIVSSNPAWATQGDPLLKTSSCCNVLKSVGWGCGSVARLPS